MDKRALSVAVVGDVDHGKSTLLARLLHGAGALPETRIADARRAATMRGVEFEWSFALDALQAERDQAVTIGVARARATIDRRDILFRDAPGHSRFASAAATAAAAAQTGLLVVDARAGLTIHARRHARAAAFLGVTRWIVAVNKMDLVAWDEGAAVAVEAAARQALGELRAEVVQVVPVAAYAGDNVVDRSAHMPWYAGPPLAAALAGMPATGDARARGLRLPIQDVYRRGDARVLVGRVESGEIRAGQEILLSPSGETVRVAALVADGASAVPATVAAGANAAFTLERPVYVARGEFASAPDDAPALVDAVIADILWLADPGDAALRARIGAREVSALLEGAVRPVVGEIAHARIRFGALVALDPGAPGVLVAHGRIVAGFRVGAEAIEDLRHLDRRGVTLGHAVSAVTRREREARIGHRGGVVWLTGLPASGKSTLASGLERRLFNLGWRVGVLDGDNLRRGLNADLGFAPADRAENIRRAGAVAVLMADTGILCIAAFVSPYRADRARARAAAGEAFREVFVRATPEICAARDPKGHYAKARAGQLPGFTGVDGPYEAPDAPDLILDTTEADVDTCVRRLTDYVRHTFGPNSM